MEENQPKRLALVVEANTGHAQTILEALGRGDSTCEVVVKHDGPEALDYLLCRGAYAGRDPAVMPCVTLVDLALAHSEGLELLRQIDDHEQTRRLPVVAFSSAGEQHHREQVEAAYALGANSYIGIRPEFESFEDSLSQVARFWCVVNEPPPPPPLP